jgi:hypothetical protein
MRCKTMILLKKCCFLHRAKLAHVLNKQLHASRR